MQLFIWAFIGQLKGNDWNIDATCKTDFILLCPLDIIAGALQCAQSNLNNLFNKFLWRVS